MLTDKRIGRRPLGKQKGTILKKFGSLCDIGLIRLRIGNIGKSL